jgi:TolB protein
MRDLTRRLLLASLMLMIGASACAPGAGQPSGPTPRLAYVGLDDHVYTVPVSGGDPRRVSAAPGEAMLPAGQRLARWPTWSADGSRLAFMRFELSRTADSKAMVYSTPGDGGELTRLFESTEEFPIYMGWTPDAGMLTLLAQRGDGLRLLLLDPSGGRPPREVASGNPLYFAWSPDSQHLLVHVGGDSRADDRASIGVWRAAGGSNAALPIPARPGDFRAPGWSADGARMGFVQRVPGGQAALAVQDVNAAEPTRLTILSAEAALVWSPAADRLAFSSRVSPEAPVYRGIETVRADGGERHQVTDGLVAGFFWSPDGRRLAYAAMDVQKRALVWFVADPDGKNRKELASFEPSQEQLFVFQFFDQYAQSHGVWSPDGKYLVYSAAQAGSGRTRLPGDPPEAPGRERPPEPSRVFVVPVDGSAPARALVDGSFGVWPVPAPRKR